MLVEATRSCLGALADRMPRLSVALCVCSGAAAHVLHGGYPGLPRVVLRGLQVRRPAQLRRRRLAGTLTLQLGTCGCTFSCLWWTLSEPSRLCFSWCVQELIALGAANILSK